MADYKDLLKRLDEFRNYRKPDIKLSEVEKLMKEIGVERISTGKSSGKKKGQGSKVFYYHPILKSLGESGHFTIHKIHGSHKKNEKISKIDYKRYLYKPLEKIIQLLHMNGAL